MASRYNQEYFFQHLLTNITFTNLNNIIHPNAENIPGTLHHFASAMFINGCYWNDMAKVQYDHGNRMSQERLHPYLSDLY